LSPEEEPSPTISEPPVSEDSEPSTEPEVVLDTDDLIEPDENLPPQEEVVSDDVPVSEEVTRREPGKEETETADLQTEPDAQVDNAGNSIGSARDIGTLTQEVQSFTGFVEDIDKVDYYQFSLDDPADVSLGLDADVNLYLIQDANGNGIWEDDEIALLNEWVAFPESINMTMSAGTYFAVVEQSSGNTSYTLSINLHDDMHDDMDDMQVDNAGNSIGSARDIGTLTQEVQSFTGFGR